MLKKIFKETTIYALGPQVPRLASFFILPIITKDLTSYDYGIAALVTSYIGILSALKALGLTDLFLNYFYKHPKSYKLIWRHLLGFLISYSFVFAFIQGALLYIILPLEFAEKITVILLNIVPVVFFENINVFSSRHLQLKHRPLPVASISAISGIVSVCCNLYTISYLKMGYMGWFVSTLIGSLVQFVFFFRILLKSGLTPIFNFRWKFIKRYLRIALPFVPNKYGHYMLNSSDRVVMDVISVPTATIGLYNFGYNLGNYAQILVNSLGIAISPFYLKLFANDKAKDYSTAREVTNYIQILFVMGTFVGALWLREIFDVLVSNETLKTTYDVAIIIVMMQNYAPIRFFFTNFIVYKEQTNFLWKITFVGGILNVLLNIWLIPKYGIIVAAITTYFTMFFISIVGFYHKDYIKVKTINFYPILWFLLSSVCCGIVFYLKDIDYTYKIMISSVVLILSGVILYKKKNLVTA